MRRTLLKPDEDTLDLDPETRSWLRGLLQRWLGLGRGGYAKEPIGGEDPVCPEIIDPTVRLGRRFRGVGGEQLRGHGVYGAPGVACS